MQENRSDRIANRFRRNFAESEGKDRHTMTAACRVRQYNRQVSASGERSPRRQRGRARRAGPPGGNVGQGGAVEQGARLGLAVREERGLDAHQEHLVLEPVPGQLVGRRQGR